MKTKEVFSELKYVGLGLLPVIAKIVLSALGVGALSDCLIQEYNK